MPLSKQEAELPLYGFFKGLRKSGFALGIDDYASLWTSWNGGFGLEDGQQLYRMCRTLWFKPGQSLAAFEELFQKCWQEIRRQAGVEVKSNVLEVERNSTPQVPPPVREPSSINTPAPNPAENTLNQVSSESEENELQYVSLQVGRGDGKDQPTGLAPVSEARTFLFQGSYQPMNPRQASLVLRFLRQKYHVPGTGELDLDATVKAIAREGRLLEPVMKPLTRFRNDVLFLVDHGGSMVAFHAFGDLLAAALPGGASVLYFHDAISGFVYNDPGFGTGIALEALRVRYSGKKPPVLIFSDGGAARGKYQPELVASLSETLKEIRTFSGPIAWINPVPKSRWEKTSAQYIDERVVPMFEATEQGLAGAVRELRGKQKRQIRG